MTDLENSVGAKAYFLIKNGDASAAFEQRKIDIKKPGPGQVLLAVEGFGLNFAEVMARLGLYREAPPLPFVPGYDCVGRVVEIGEGVDANLLNKRVVAMARFGTYATYCLTLASGIAEISDEMPAGEASALGVQYTTAYYAAMHAIRLMPGERVLVHAGAGGVGTALIQLCKLAGCEVFATAGSEEKLAIMKHQGADHVINYRAEDFESKCRALLNGKRMDVSFNAVGGVTFKKDMRLLGTAGRMVIYGAAQRASSRAGILPTIKLLWQMGLVLPIMLMAKSRSIVGVNALKLADNRPDIISHCMKECVRLYNEGKIRPVLGEAYEAKDLARAHDAMEKRQTSGKVFVKW